MDLQGLQGGLTPPQGFNNGLQIQAPDIYKALLARMATGTQGEVPGASAQLQPPSLEAQPTDNKAALATAVMARLAGAPAHHTGGYGVMGGIGDALYNMYDSRMAQSANEVAQAQADKAAQDLAARQEAAQAAIYKREEDMMNKREADRQASPEYALDIKHKSLQNQILENSLARAAAGPSGSGGPSGASKNGINALWQAATVVDPSSYKTTTDWSVIGKKALAGDPNAIIMLRQRDAVEAKDATKEDQATAKQINAITNQTMKIRTQYEKIKDDPTKESERRILAEQGKELKDRLNAYNQVLNPTAAAPSNQPAQQQSVNIPLSNVQYDEQGNAYIEQ